jgi:S-adenosylmethionine:tRNA ribosyltransferase-isomerase
VLVSDFDFFLPPELIAQHPPVERAASRMLHLKGNSFEDRLFTEFPALLRGSDLVVFNDTRVLPARLFGHRSGSRAQRLSRANPASREFLQGRVEVLLTRRLPGEEQLWQALVRPGKKIMPGEKLHFGGTDQGSSEAGASLLEAEVLTRGEFGERTLRFAPVPDFFARLEELGHIPLPPYIDRDDTPEDRVRYQTVYARDPGSVAAPTAGLHFTEEILKKLRDRGIETASLTLHVGLGTFSPIRTEVVEEHKIHTEWYQISEETAGEISSAKRDGRRVVAIGTTTVRTLEYAAGGAQEQDQKQGQLPHPSQLQARMGHPETSGGPHPSSVGECGAAITAHSGEADIFIYPGYRFRVVDAMLTNFHLPKSTLLMLVSAFAGRENVLAAYNHAVHERYRFFSYGDCMFIE